MASAELAAKLERRRLSCEATEEASDKPSQRANVNFRAADFPDFSLREIRHLENLFEQFTNRDDAIEFETLKTILQQLECAQTHIGLKKLLESVSMEKANTKPNMIETSGIDFPTFMLLLRKIRLYEVRGDEVIHMFNNFNHVHEVNVQETGVSGAKDFFEAKVSALGRDVVLKQEVELLRDKRRKEDDEKRSRISAFRDKQTIFQ